MLRYSTIVVAATLLCHSAMAQTATGIIQGRVMDASGGAVPEAAVKIENKCADHKGRICPRNTRKDTKKGKGSEPDIAR